MVSRFAPNGEGEGFDSLTSWLDCIYTVNERYQACQAACNNCSKERGSKEQLVVQLSGMHLMIGATLRSKRRTGCRKTQTNIQTFFF